MFNTDDIIPLTKVFYISLWQMIFKKKEGGLKNVHKTTEENVYHDHIGDPKKPK